MTEVAEDSGLKYLLPPYLPHGSNLNVFLLVIPRLLEEPDVIV
jgi:hypothetical protein